MMLNWFNKSKTENELKVDDQYLPHATKHFEANKLNIIASNIEKRQNEIKKLTDDRVNLANLIKNTKNQDYICVRWYQLTDDLKAWLTENGYSISTNATTMNTMISWNQDK